MQFTLFVFVLAFVFSHFRVMAAPILSGLSISERDADYLSTAISDTDFDDLTNLLETRAFAPAKAIGNIGCNIARAKTVAALAGASLAMKNLQVMCAGNASASSAVSSASSGLSQSRAAVAQIAAEIVTLQAPSAQARDATLAGLTTAKNSLATISSSNPAVMKAVSAASNMVDKTMAAGGEVVAQC